MLFWRTKKTKRSCDSPLSESAVGNAQDEQKENENIRPRSASFSVVNVDGKENIGTDLPKTKKKRSHSMGHKVKRRNSFIRLYKAARDIGRTLRQIGDDLESRHSNSSLSVSSKIR